MAQPVESEPPALAEDLLRDLHGFLSLEAPFLIRDLPQARDESELEAALVDRLRHLFRTGPRFESEELWPGLTHEGAVERSREDVEERVRGFFRRRRLETTISDAERRAMLGAMLLTRAVDDFLKGAFDRKQVRWGDHPSPQKGFRSTGQEAIVGACLRLRRPPEYPAGPSYAGDFVAPLIRDLGALLMFRPDPLHPILVQYGKAGTPVGGRDLHVGDWEHGVLPPAAPLAIAAQTMVGMAYAWKLRGEDRVGITFIGEGGSSLGEWHEAVNLAAVQRLAVVFVLENNQWALGTHVSEQSAVRRFADKAAGYGIPGVSLRGNDPERVAAAVAWAAERARRGAGPALVELVSYRRSGHAHHDDDRFRGAPGLAGYEHENERGAWEALDPVDGYRRRLLDEGVINESELAALEAEVRERVERAAEAANAAPWPDPTEYRSRVEAPRTRPRAPAGCRTTRPYGRLCVRPWKRIPLSSSSARTSEAGTGGPSASPAVLLATSATSDASTRRCPSRRSSAAASVRRWPARVRSSRCSSRISWPRASTRW
jgi:TPP-dependent pyruvate/acetoin dehydrogenase alpha subunit